MTPLVQTEVSSAVVARVAAFWVFGLFLTAGLVAQSAGSVFGLWFCELFIFLGASWVVLAIYGYRPWRVTGASSFDRSHLAVGLTLGTLNLFAVVLPIQAVAVSSMPEAWAKAFDSSRLLDGRGGVGLWALLGSVILAAPFCEEFFFRGVLQNLWNRAPGIPRTAACVGSAILFSALHLDPVGFAARLELGLLFGFLFLRTGSLWPGIFAHAANNGVSCALYFAAKAAGQDESAGPDLKTALMLGAVFGAPFVLALRQGFRRLPSPDPTSEEGLRDLPQPWFRALWPWLSTAVVAAAVFAVLR